MSRKRALEDALYLIFEQHYEVEDVVDRVARAFKVTTGEANSIINNAMVDGVEYALNNDAYIAVMTNNC